MGHEKVSHVGYVVMIGYGGRSRTLFLSSERGDDEAVPPYVSE